MNQKELDKQLANVINALSKSQLTSYLKTVRNIIHVNGVSNQELERNYNHNLFRLLNDNWRRHLVVVMLINYVRSQRSDPCPLWNSIYLADGNLRNKKQLSVVGI